VVPRDVGLTVRRAKLFRWVLAWPLCRLRFAFFLLAAIADATAMSVQGRHHIPQDYARLPPSWLDDVKRLRGYIRQEWARALLRR
jgi:hypothetical protein